MIEMTKEDSDSTQGHAPNGQSCLKWNGLECGGPLTGVVPAKVRRQPAVVEETDSNTTWPVSHQANTSSWNF